MFKNLFRKKEEEEQSKKRSLLWLILGAVIIIAIVLALLFVWPGFLNKKNNSQTQAKLKVTVITKKDCPECWDTSLFTDALSQYNVKITSSSTLYYDSGKGQDLVKQYKITKIPTLIIQGDLDKDPNLAPFWQALGDVSGDTFVFRQVIPPYIDVASGQLKGKVHITYLTDTACKDCYDVGLHENALRNLAIPTTDAKTVDISSAEGKAFVSKYKITKVPTVLISGEVSEYGNLSDLWSQVGEVASDGTYIFTDTDLMGPYMDLSKNKLVTPPPATTTPDTSVTPDTPAIQ